MNNTNQLSRAEMKNVMGGVADKSYDAGQCIGSVGSWSYTTAVSWQSCENDIAMYCRSGSGECHVAAS